MADVVKVYKEHIPAIRFVGKKYGDSDQVNGFFSAKWDEWFANHWFSPVEKQVTASMKEIYLDADAYVGLMRWKEDVPFEYWIGMLLPENALVPKGYEYIDFPESDLGVCWVYGKENDVYGKETLCSDNLTKAGYKPIADRQGTWSCLERYACPRFTTPDDQGNIILDICYFIA